MTDQQRHEAEMRIDYESAAKRKATNQRIANQNNKWQTNLQTIRQQAVADGSYMMPIGSVDPLKHHPEKV